MLSRPDVERAIDRVAEDARTHFHEELHDWWHGNLAKGFTDCDGISIIGGPPDELRLVWSMGVDGFNPFFVKAAKKSRTSTGIYLVLLNLPPDMRYKDENICLVGVIPGPGKPSLEQINHFLRLIVDDLLEFWSPGVYFSRTALRPQGRFAYGFLIPLVCDQLAARQVGGLPSSSGTHLCSFCFITKDMIENFDETTWPSRDLDHHRQWAMEWRDAPDEAARQAIFNQEGLRYTELLRLPYWDPRRFVVVDSMHAHYLCDFEDLIRDVWGADPDVPSGLGKRPPGFKVPSCPAKTIPTSWSGHMRKLADGSVDQLSQLTWPALWHMCYDRDLRRAGTKLMLARHLVRWVSWYHHRIRIRFGLTLFTLRERE